MNAASWPALREYIAAEIQLALARQEMARLRTFLNTRAVDGPAIAETSRLIKRLEEQSTRMETAVRESLPVELPHKPGCTFVTDVGQVSADEKDKMMRGLCPGCGNEIRNPE